ncbi:MAG: archaeal heat shock protein Hsp20 [Candidatus Thorarchaeota archaeon]|jgi:HSP20 family protein
MSWDNPFGSDEDPREALRKWLGNFLPESMFKEIEEMMDRMMEQMRDGTLFDPSEMEQFMKDPQGTNPFVFGFQMRVGPDGKPILQRFGNTPDDEGSKMTPHLEPLVDVIEEDDEVIVVAELPGVDKDSIKVRVKGSKLTIDVDDAEKPYHKVVELPSKVKKENAKSAIRNGVLEVRLMKAL